MRKAKSGAVPLLERERTGLNTLKVGYNRVHGYYIELSRSQSDQAPVDYIRRQTLKNAERYIIPELKAFEDQALTAQARALKLERAGAWLRTRPSSAPGGRSALGRPSNRSSFSSNS